MMLLYYLLAVPLLCLVSAGMYWFDKRLAENKSRRIPEATLLAVDLLGGWPGGWWSQQKFRHKTKKQSFRVKYYLAILGNVVLIYLIATGKIGWDAIREMGQDALR